MPASAVRTRAAKYSLSALSHRSSCGDRRMTHHRGHRGTQRLDSSSQQIFIPADWRALLDRTDSTPLVPWVTQGGLRRRLSQYRLRPLTRSDFHTINVHPSQTSSAGQEHNGRMTPESLTRTVQEFLSEASGAVVLEGGAVMFDLAQAKYSISGEYNKCLLHLWSAERNTVRRVLDAEVKSGMLRLAVTSLGQTRPTKLEICRQWDRRSPSAKKAARAAYEHKLRRAMERHFPGFAILRLTTGVDLESRLVRSMRVGWCGM